MTTTEIYSGGFNTTRRNCGAARLLCATVVRLFLAVGLVAASGVALAAEPVAKSRLTGVAIGGHDSVAYHSLAKDPQAPSVAGKKSFVVKFKGAKWRFADQASADKFAAEPEKYSPAYNGHCANALSLGEGLIRTDGTHWEIFDDQLYLFFAARGRSRWNDGNWQSYKTEADAAWQQLK